GRVSANTLRRAAGVDVVRSFATSCDTAFLTRAESSVRSSPRLRLGATSIALLLALAAAWHPLLVEALAQQTDPIAAPEQLVFESERRHSENAGGLGLVAQPVVLGTALADQEVREPGR